MGWSDWVANPNYFFYRPPNAVQNVITAAGRDDTFAEALYRLQHDGFSADESLAGNTLLEQLDFDQTGIRFDSAAYQGIQALNTGFGMTYEATVGMWAMFVRPTPQPLPERPEKLPFTAGLKKGRDYIAIPGTDRYIQYENHATTPIPLGFYLHVPLFAAMNRWDPIMGPQELVGQDVVVEIWLLNRDQMAPYFATRSGDRIITPSWSPRPPGTPWRTFAVPSYGAPVWFDVPAPVSELQSRNEFGLLMRLRPTTRTDEVGMNVQSVDWRNGPRMYDDPPAGLLQRFKFPRYRYWIPESILDVAGSSLRAVNFW